MSNERSESPVIEVANAKRNAAMEKTKPELLTTGTSIKACVTRPTY